jgi:hypothetical protein
MSSFKSWGNSSRTKTSRPSSEHAIIRPPRNGDSLLAPSTTRAALLRGIFAPLQYGALGFTASFTSNKQKL